MDRLGIMAALSTATGVEIPERDYASLTTIRRLVAYLT
jgi:acyl carrier protein